MDVILSYSYPDRYGCYAILFLLSIFLHKQNLYTTPCIVPGSRGRSEGTAREDSEWTAAREGAQNGLLLARTQKGLRLARVFEPSPRCLCPFPLLLHFECVRDSNAGAPHSNTGGVQSARESIGVGAIVKASTEICGCFGYGTQRATH